MTTLQRDIAGRKSDTEARARRLTGEDIAAVVRWPQGSYEPGICREWHRAPGLVDEAMRDAEAKGGE